MTIRGIYYGWAQVSNGTQLRWSESGGVSGSTITRKPLFMQLQNHVLTRALSFVAFDLHCGATSPNGL